MKLLPKIKKKILIRHRKEIIKSYGNEFADKIFYVIRRTGGGGLFSHIISNIGRINYAVTNGYIPVIDMQNYFNVYLTDDTFRKVNVWENYFLQPCGYRLNDIVKAKNVILSDTDIIENRPRGTMECLNNESGILDFWKIIVSKYLILNKETEIHVKDQCDRIFANSKRVLGVICRGTDYTASKPKGHWVQPETQVVIEKAHKVMNDFNCDKIFLATEDKSIWNEFNAEFGEDILITNNKEWVDYKGGSIHNYSIDREDDNFIKGLEYLTTIYILSECNCLIGGRAGGTVGAMIMSKGYEYQYFWDLGEY